MASQQAWSFSSCRARYSSAMGRHSSRDKHTRCQNTRTCLRKAACSFLSISSLHSDRTLCCPAMDWDSSASAAAAEALASWIALSSRAAPLAPFSVACRFLTHGQNFPVSVGLEVSWIWPSYSPARKGSAKSSALKPCVGAPAAIPARNFLVSLVTLFRSSAPIMRRIS